MKIFKILYFGFAIFFVILFIYLEFYIKLISIYWLITELTGFLLIVAGRIVLDTLEGIEPGRNIFFKILWMVILLGYFGYTTINNYKRNVCEAKFGPEFNARRRSLGIPIIPANWQVDSRGTWLTTWHGKDSIGGHESKTIIFDTCRVNREDDEYYLIPADGVSRHMEIISQYAQGRGDDSIFYNYEIGDSTRRLSRQQADSILTAEKIQKDY